MIEFITIMFLEHPGRIWVIGIISLIVGLFLLTIPSYAGLGVLILLCVSIGFALYVASKAIDVFVDWDLTK